MSAEEEAQNIIDTEEVIVPQEDFNSAFDDLEEVEEKEGEEKESPEEEEEEKEPLEEKEEEKESPKEEEEEKEEELSALEQAEKQAREKFLPKKDEEKENDEGEKSEDEKKVDEAPAEIDFTDVDSDPGKFVNDLIGKAEVSGDEKKRLQDTLESYPEIGKIAAMVARELVGRQTVKVTTPEDYIGQDEVKAQFEKYAETQKVLVGIQAEMSERRYFDSIEKEVPGARAIAGSDKFSGWLDGQSVGINTLANSGDPEDAVAVLKAFKEYEVRAAAKVVDEKASKKKAKVDAGMKKVVKTTSSKTAGDNKDDFNAGFDS